MGAYVLAGVEIESLFWKHSCFCGSCGGEWVFVCIRAHTGVVVVGLCLHVHEPHPPNTQLVVLDVSLGVRRTPEHLESREESRATEALSQYTCRPYIIQSTFVFMYAGKRVEFLPRCFFSYPQDAFSFEKLERWKCEDNQQLQSLSDMRLTSLRIPDCTLTLRIPHKTSVVFSLWAIIKAVSMHAVKGLERKIS